MEDDKDMFPEAGMSSDGVVSPWRAVVTESETEAIFDEHVNLVVWRRHWDRLPDSSVFMDPPRRLMRAVSGDPVNPMQIVHALGREGPCALTADLANLVELFAILTGTSEIGIRLETSAKQTCPKWHTDRVSLRLMTTYCGPGTEWLDGATVHRSATGDVLLAKGELWSCTPGACLHRSPDPLGVPRLLLTLDALE